MSQFAAMPSYNHAQPPHYGSPAVGPSQGGHLQPQPGPSPVQYRGHGYNLQPASLNSRHDNVNNHLANLAQSMSGLNLHSLPPAHSGRVNNTYSGQAPAVTHMVGTNSGESIYLLPDGRLMIAGMTSPQPPIQQAPPTLKPAAQPYIPQITLQNCISGQPVIPALPQQQNWTTHPVTKEVPDLDEPRRTSLSSNEENAPATPYLGAVTHGEYAPSVAITDRSVSNGTVYSTGPGQQVSQIYLPLQISKGTDGQYTYLDLDALTQQEPAIPTAVPAPWSSNAPRTLDKALKNEFGITNVYIRGLLPDTTDEMLHSYAARFGEIISCKAILDLETGLCKGFGFVNFHNYVQCENCIRGFFHLGYEVSFARESHNSRLKTLADPANTNLYVSNLPRNFNEVNLKDIFEGYKVVSAKILRDSNGINRGVGFARMENHDICEEVIAKYHGQVIGEHGNKLQIRYADTDEQKKLKNLTTERRQFKTHEYNTVVFGTASPYQYPSPTSDGLPSNVAPHVQGAHGIWVPQPSISPSIASQSPSITNGVLPSFAIPGYVMPIHGRRSPRDPYAVDSPSTVIHKPIAQDKPKADSLVKLTVPDGKVNNATQVIVHNDDVSSTSSAPSA